MVDVFISYAHEDRNAAARLASCLQVRGWSVWWDREVISGADPEPLVAAALAEARSAIVLWSSHSATSVAIKEEARLAAARELLILVRIEDGVEVPESLGHLQLLDCSEWSGDLFDQSYANLERAITKLTRPPRAELGSANIAVSLETESRLSQQPLLHPSHRRSEVPIFGYGIAIGMAVAVVATAGLMGQSPEPSAAGYVQSAQAARAMATREVRLTPQLIEASSQSKAGHFPPEAAFDGRMDTAWASNGSKNGATEWIEVSFSRPVHVERVVLITGRQSMLSNSTDLFYRSARPSLLQVVTEHQDRGDWSRMVQIGQHERQVEIDVGRDTGWLRFAAIEIWSPVNTGIAGYGDVSISEIQLYGFPLP